MRNFIEELIAEYYKTKGYFVSTNYWIPFISERNRVQKGKEHNYTAQSWTDIDILASNKNELLLIQVKSLVNQKDIADKIILHFERIEQFLERGVALDGESKIDWWTKNLKVRKIVIYENYSPPSYLKILNEKGIETTYFEDRLIELINYVKQKKGVKEENVLMRFLHCLSNYGLLNK